MAELLIQFKRKNRKEEKHRTGTQAADAKRGGNLNSSTEGHRDKKCNNKKDRSNDGNNGIMFFNKLFHKASII